MSRSEQVFREAIAENHRRTSRLFAALMAAQWLFGVFVSLLWSPLAWAGRSSSVHVHVYTAMVLGAVITSLPVWLALTRPSAPVTRYVIAIAQMLWSALLIHLTGGRIETHFHVFGSLAFLAFYRDWKVLVPATLVVASDHFLRGLLWPESVYGLSNPEWWRFVEHALWVVFEDTVLVLGCLRGTQETRLVAQRQAEAESSLERLNELNRGLDQRVAERTAHLERTQAELLEASRRAGKADVATAVLHNVGNALNSINVSCGVLLDTARGSRLPRLHQAGALLSSAEVAPLLEGHPRAKQLPAYLGKLAAELENERGVISSELEDLQRNVEHVKVIVSMQQSHAKGSLGALEAVPFTTLVDDALRMSAMKRTDRDIEVRRELEELPPTLIDRHKVFQILMNLLSNARHAITAAKRPGAVTLRLQRHGDVARLEVADDGCGIAPGDLSRIFTLGFTTKKEGHGFGLHSSACAALEMGGRLTAASLGPGRGATFTLELPLRAHRAAA